MKPIIYRLYGVVFGMAFGWLVERFAPNQGAEAIVLLLLLVALSGLRLVGRRGN